ncbi:hypothetical protein XMIN_3692 [Xanthomonas citri pv. mangiferaeindicae LMG 941]|nr:hypothetical protein XMIN_3692 [Xanthomonas citri pv. mangiferaeindicae LMG 941]
MLSTAAQRATGECTLSVMTGGGCISNRSAAPPIRMGCCQAAPGTRHSDEGSLQR